MSVQERSKWPTAGDDIAKETNRLLSGDAAADSGLSTAVAEPGLLGRLRRLINVEPVVFLTTFAFMLAYGTVRVEFLTQAVGESLNYTTHGEDSNESGVCVINKSDPNYLLGERVQAISSYWSLGLDATSSLLMLFSALFLGSYSERGGGRKRPLLITIVGLMLSIVNLLVVIMFDLPVPYLFIGEILRGATGGLYTTFAIAFAYISDITPKKQLTMRIIIAESAIYVGGCVSQIGVGYWIKRAGFLPALWMSLGVTLLTVLYIVAWLEETKALQRVDISPCDQFRDAVAVFANKPRGDASKLAVMSSVFFLTAMLISSSVITMLYIIAPPFCFDAVDIGYYQTVAFSANGIGLLVGGKLLSCCLGDLGIVQVSFLSGVGSYLIVAFAQNSWMILAAPLVGCLSGLTFPVLRGRVSKLVKQEELGVIFTLLGGIQGIGLFVSPLVFNNVYASTVEFMPNTVYLVFASTLVMTSAMIGALQLYEFRGRKTSSPRPGH